MLRLLFTHRLQKCLSASVVVASLALAGTSSCAKAPDADVRDIVGPFFAVYLGRDLTDSELDEVMREYIAYYGKPDCEADCRAALESLVEATDKLRQSSDSPEAAFLRHSLAAPAVVGEQPPKQTIRQLLREPDPAVVVNPESKRFMTEHDLSALGALAATAESGEPTPISPYSNQDRAELLAQLETAFGSKTNRLPVRLALASEFQIGLKDPALAKEERRQVARFVIGQDTAVIPVQTIDKVLHVGDETAKSIYQAAELDRALFALQADLNRNLGAILRANRDWSTLQSVGRASR